MKNQVLFALGACYALCFPIAAQNTKTHEPFRDTLVIAASANMKILFIGSDIEEMKDYRRADSLKNFLLTDITRAHEQSSYPSASKLTHYLVHPSGKRRLKAESEDYQEPLLDLRKEIRSMDLNLPSFTYIIYDIAFDYEIQIYLSQPELLSSLEKINLNEAIRSIAAGKKSQRKFSNIEIRPENGQWVRKSSSNKKTKTLELNTMLGAAILGGELTPELGIQLSYTTSDKHASPVFRIGYVSSFYVLSEYSNREFTNFYGVRTYNLSLMMRDGKFSTGRWFGFELGMADAEGGYMDGKYKLGLMYSINSIQGGFHFFTSTFGNKNNENLLYGFSVRFVL